MKPKLISGDGRVDDRGSVTFINDFDFGDVKRFYVVENHKAGFVRAWHGHEKEGKYVFVVSGAALIGVRPLTEGDADITPFVLSDKTPEILYIPPGNYNGFKTLTDNTKLVFFSTSTVEESQIDDIRKPAKLWDIWGDQWR